MLVSQGKRIMCMDMNKSKGFTILEVLIAMVILSIGVLGLGMLQLTSLQSTQGGHMRSQASILAYDIVDSMRANIPAVSDGNYGLTYDAATPDAVDCYGSEADCTTNQMAISDLNRWRTMLGNYLPSGNGQVAAVDIGGTTQVTVGITWVDPYSAEIGNEQIVLLSELPQ
jgi:type IV pilus assembly protein PilV